MDADYLQKNILDALSEAVASMAIKMPDDEVEFIGKYLLKYVERKAQLIKQTKEIESVESSLNDYLLNEEVKKKKQNDLALAVTAAEAKFSHFMNSLNNQTSKSSAMASVVDFIESSLDIPAAYIAIKQVAGEVETLYYLEASSSQQHVKGKKLVKVVAEEGDDAPIRQGITFDAFKLPEVPEEEAAPEEPEEGAEPKPPKPAPKMSPLLVENTMREKRVKFFGIPKLGAYAALPFSFQSIEHENGCVFNPGDADSGVAPSFALSKLETHFVIGIDTIGKYRLIKAEEIARINLVGEELVKVFEKCEEKVGRDHLEYVNGESLAAMAAAVAEVSARLPDEETRVKTEAAEAVAKAAAEAAEAAAQAAAALAAAAAAAAEDGGEVEPPAEAEAAEPSPAAALLSPFKEAEAAVTLVWNPALGAGAVADSLLALQGYVLPLPKSALSVLYAVCCMVNFDPQQLKDVCLELNWEAIRSNVLLPLPGAIASYSPAAEMKLLSKECSLAAVKEFAAANNIAEGADASMFPANLPVFVLLVQWLQKAIAAREAAMAYFSELEPKVILEL